MGGGYSYKKKKGRATFYKKKKKKKGGLLTFSNILKSKNSAQYKLNFHWRPKKKKTPKNSNKPYAVESYRIGSKLGFLKILRFKSGFY